MTLIFDDNDERYLEWLAANPEGLVVNCRRAPSPDYMVLHSAACLRISQRRGNQRFGGFTERSYVKICGASEAELRAAIQNYGAKDFSGICRCLTEQMSG